MALPTRDLLGIPLMAVGGPYRGRGSPPEGDFYDEERLRRVAEDSNRVVDEIRPVNKIGHNSGQLLARRSGFFDEDDQPATGFWRNFRVEGGKLLGDVLGVPKKLADLIEVGAFGRRSVEMKPYESQRGKGRVESPIRYVAWLGAKAPAIKTLDDVVSLYGDDENDDDDMVIVEYAESGAPTAELDLRIDLEPIANGDDEVLTPPADTRGEMPDEPITGLTLTEEQRDQLAQALGVEGEVTPEALLARAAEARTLADARETEGSDETDEADETDDDTPPARTEPVATGVSLSETEYHDLRTRADAGARAAEELRVQRRDRLITEAMTDGRLEPGQRDEFVRMYDENEDFTTRAITALVPNEERSRSYGSEDEHQSTADEDRLYEEFSEFQGRPVERTGS
jgi:hypothetical protein